jgi:Bacterial PH domain
MQASTEETTVFRSRFNRAVAVVAWALCVYLVAVSAIEGGGAAAAQALLPAAFVALGAWAVLWRPLVSVEDDGVLLRNVARSIRVPWAALIDVETRWALTLRVPGAAYSALAAPAPGRTTAMVARRRERQHGPAEYSGAAGGRSRPGDLAGTASGDAAYLVRERWHRLREAGGIELGQADLVRAEVRWHWLTLGALAALAVASAFVLAA